MVNERFLSPQAIALQLNITDRAVLDLIQKGKLPAIRVGSGRGVWRISERHYATYLAKRQRDEGQEPEDS